MFAIGAPDAPTLVPDRNGLLNITGAVRRQFVTEPAIAARPDHESHLRSYVADLARPYGVGLREDSFARTEGHSYGEMGRALIEAALPAAEPVDLLALAFAVPDIRPGRATAVYLSEVCPGNPFAFAVSDQGTAAVFTALRLIGGYARATGCRRALLLVLEQAAQHYESRVDTALFPDGHAGVALVLEPADAANDLPGAARLRAVRQQPAIAPEAVAGALAAELAHAHMDVRADTDPHLLVLGNGLASSRESPATGAGSHDLRFAPRGQPYTGLWWELAGVLTEQPAGTPRRLLVADYDPMLRYLCTSTVDLVAGT